MFLQSRRIQPWTSRVREKVSQFCELVVGAPGFEPGTSCARSHTDYLLEVLPFQPVSENKGVSQGFGSGTTHIPSGASYLP